MVESGRDADARRMNALLLPNGALVIPPRLKPWVADVLLNELTDMRRNRYSDERASDVLDLIDALMLSDKRQPVMENVKIENEATGVGRAPIGSPYALLTSAQVAAELRVSSRTVTRLIVGGHLVAQRSGRSYLVSREALENYKEGA